VFGLDNSTRRLDDFILTQAASNLDQFRSKWIVAASFDAFPVTDSVHLPLPLPSGNASPAVQWSQVYSTLCRTTVATSTFHRTRRIVGLRILCLQESSLWGISRELYYRTLSDTLKL